MKKAQVGLRILLSVIVSIFLIGLLVMVYSLLSSGMIDSDSLYTAISGTNVNETVASVEDINGENFSVLSYRSPSCIVLDVTNATNGVLIGSTNYTVDNCHIVSTGRFFNNTNWNITYSYSALARTEAINIINDTVVATAGVTTWFPIMIVITAMVVLILLTVIIITAIRGSGLMGEGNKGNKKGGGNIGTA